MIKYNVKEAIIENQPAKKNANMKTIANSLYMIFRLRGLHDNHYKLNDVKFICPSNKLKIDNDNTIQVLKGAENKKYKLTKQLGIKYTRNLLSSQPQWLEHLDKYKKKDDLCDAYLQGLYYIMFKMNKSVKELYLEN